MNVSTILKTFLVGVFNRLFSPKDSLIKFKRFLPVFIADTSLDKIEKRLLFQLERLGQTNQDAKFLVSLFKEYFDDCFLKRLVKDISGLSNTANFTKSFQETFLTILESTLDRSLQEHYLLQGQMVQSQKQYNNLLYLNPSSDLQKTESQMQGLLSDQILGSLAVIHEVELINGQQALNRLEENKNDLAERKAEGKELEKLLAETANATATNGATRTQ